MKLVDYGSDSEGEESQEQEQNQQNDQKNIQKEKDQSIDSAKGENNEAKQCEEGGKQIDETKKKITIKYKDLPKFLNPTIHKEKDDKKDLWKPKSIQEIQNERKKRMEDLSETNDKKSKFTKVMRLPSPKRQLQNDEVSSFQLKKQVDDKPVLPPYINPENLFNKDIDEGLVEQYDQDDIYINKRYQNIQSNNDAESREAKFANNRQMNEDELKYLDSDNTNITSAKISEISREQLIGDSNWLLNYQKQQQQNIIKSGYHLNSQVDKTQKSKNQLNALAVDAIANQDNLDYERSEQIKNAKRKRDRYGW
ncbi:hypothetical protein TTHERM_00803630 (macronuclear) [Tetrahymena thermophila SB210]|uniref:Uncharacterized protein n=1 Tax=Tetrahymena thermophila (strain SB210) TaxID=312017 RepID=Q235D7_TETTS|nr:hypothetical protein TTHERM_00803630 [Tetrahymena thermophila SB210]EAR92166.1 hypothetical protein TTHERM_00803630 [Tetrahymena thermophila SB210]|eukprot:XP_001012411.1 hypothetical protein TTHERM_00803630 [Tetrahymena thermophila SB210]